jgi:hypothetical protein
MHNREVDRLRAELVHLDATLRYPADDFGSRKRWPRRTDYFARGELTRLVFEALRENGTTAAGELVAAAMTARSIPESDGAIRRISSPGSSTTLHDLSRRETVEKIDQERGVQWKLAEREPGLSL